MMTHEPIGQVNAAGGGYGPPGGAPPGGFGGPPPGGAPPGAPPPGGFGAPPGGFGNAPPGGAPPGAPPPGGFGVPPAGAPGAPPAGQPAGFGHTGGPAPGGKAAENSKLAVVSLVTGILSLLPCCNFFIVPFVAIITGFLAKKEINEKGLGGGGMATAGIILGALGLIVMIGTIVLQIVFGSFDMFN